MDISSKNIEVPLIHPVFTMNQLTAQTKEVWIVFHGYGQLAKHFIRRFDVLDPLRCFVIAPQGLSRFYLDEKGTVGASWLTKEHRETEITNQLRYLDLVFEHYLSEVDWRQTTLHFFGFSQGAAVMLRFAAHRHQHFSSMIFWAGDLPKGLQRHDFDFLTSNAKIDVVIGDKDQYYDEAIVKKQIDLLQSITGIVPRMTLFHGKHEVVREVLKKLL